MKFPNNPFTSLPLEARQDVTDLAYKLYQEHNKALEQFTKDQVTRIITQIIVSGDLKMLVKKSAIDPDAMLYSVNYIPYSGMIEMADRLDEANKRIAELEAQLKTQQDTNVNPL